LRTLKITGEELAQMPQGRLNPHASGALIMFVKASRNQPPVTESVDLKNGNLQMQIPILAVAKPKP
jgi:hypothetical protein